MRALTHTETLSTTGAIRNSLVLGITGAIAGSGVAANLSFMPAFLIFVNAFEIKRNSHLGWAAVSAVAYFTASTVIGSVIGGGLGVMLSHYLENIHTSDIETVEKTKNTTQLV